jgi:hypothetical protein
MRGLIKIVAGGAIALWSLLCWAGYALGDIFKDWLAAHASWVVGDQALGSLVNALLNAAQGLGLALVLIVWAIGLAGILIPAWLALKLFRPRQRLAPVAGSREAPRPRPLYSSGHAGKGAMLGKALDAARRWK